MRPLHLIILIAAIVTQGACQRGGAATTRLPFSANLVKAANASDLEARIKTELTRRYQRMGDNYLYACAYGGVGAVTNGGQPDTPTGGNNGPDTSHSETNVQEAGVDEGDLVKTDGMYLYLARGTHFLVLSANPPDQTALVSDIDLAEQISELHIHGNRLLLITQGTASPLMPSSPRTKLYAYDITAPAAPLRTVQLEFPGYLQGSRRINTVLYLITNHTIDIPAPAWPWDYLPQGTVDPDMIAAAKDRAFAENRQQIDALTIDTMIPARSTIPYTGGVANAPTATPAVSPGNIFFPEFGNGVDLALIFSIDLGVSEPAVASSAAVFSSWCRIYMSLDSLYLASDNAWQWIQPLADKPQPLSNPEPSTALHKFSVAAATGELLYRGSAVVDGWVNNRFSMGEYQGALRIGTTRGGWWGESISNQLTVLTEQNGGLKEAGRLGGLAPGERIYSMRYDRDRGYMVTFRRTDPLFTLDLSDPTDPRVAGELVVNGFSTYIHLLGTNNSRLLTIGASADAAGMVTGNKLQLFDVANLAAPALLGQYELGPGWSEALYDPHAFTYYEPLGLLAVPYYTYGDMTSGYSSGLNIYSIGTSTIGFKGVISAPTITTGYGAYADTVDRSVIIGTTIYSLAHRSVTAAGADQLNIIKTVELPEMYDYLIGSGTTGGGGTSGNGGIVVTGP